MEIGKSLRVPGIDRYRPQTPPNPPERTISPGAATAALAVLAATLPRGPDLLAMRGMRSDATSVRAWMNYRRWKPAGMMRALCVVWLLCTVAACQHAPRVNANARVTAVLPPVHASGPVRATRVVPGSHASTRVAIIDVDGVLLNMDMVGVASLGDNPVSLFREKLDAAASDPCVRAVVLRINSPGGGVTACDIMRNDLLAFQTRTGLPVVACLMDVGAGGAYYLATSADQILAHPSTVVGGIGVILNVYKLDEALTRFSVEHEPIKAGANVDLGHVTVEDTAENAEEITAQKREILQAMADEFHVRFRQAVEHGRALEASASDEVFDGRVFTARQALDYQLIDRMGYLDDAVDVAKELGNCSQASVVLYRRSNDPARSWYAISPNVPLQSVMLPMNLPGLDRSRLPTFLYMWQPDPSLEKWGGH